MYKMIMNEITAEIYSMPQIDLNYTIAVRITAPIEFPVHVLRISQLEVIQRVTALNDLVIEKVLKLYQDLVDDMPVMELMDLPPEVTKATSVKFIQIDPLLKVGRAGIEPATLGSSGQRSTV